MSTPSISITGRSDARSHCVYCRDSVDPQREVHCSECGTALHRECADELSRCPTLGCVGQFQHASGSPHRRAPAEGQRRNWKVPALVVGALAVLSMGLSAVSSSVLEQRRERRRERRATSAPTPEPRPAVDELVNGDRDRRIDARRRLVQRGRGTIPELLAAEDRYARVHGLDERYRREALAVLVELGQPAVPVLVANLRQRRAETRLTTLAGLEALGFPPTEGAALAPVLESDRRRAQAIALRILAGDGTARMFLLRSPEAPRVLERLPFGDDPRAVDGARLLIVESLLHPRKGLAAKAVEQLDRAWTGPDPPASPEVLDGLSRALRLGKAQQDGPRLLSEVCEVYARLGGGVAGAELDPLEDALRIGRHRDDDALQRAALGALGSIGPRAAGSVSLVAEGLGDSMASVQAAQVDALVKIGLGGDPAPPEPVLEQLAALLGDDLVGAQARRALHAAGDRSAAALGARLHTASTRSDSRRLALDLLVELGGEARPAAHSLALALGDLLNRQKILDLLVAIGPEAAVPALENAIQHGSRSVQEAAVEGLRQLGPGAIGARETLERVLESPWRGGAARPAAARALAELGLVTASQVHHAATREDWELLRGYAFGDAKSFEQGMAVMLEQLSGPRHHRHRARMAYRLGALGKAARFAVPALAAALTDPSPEVRSSAAAALRRIAPQDPITRDALARAALAETESHVLDALLSALSSGRELSVPQWLQILGSAKQAEGRRRAAKALGRVPTKEAYLSLRRALLEDPEVAEEAAAALAGFGHEGVPALLEAAKSRDERIAAAAARNLVGLRSDPEGLLEHEQASVRLAALEGIPRPSLDDPDIVAAIVPLLNDPDTQVGVAAVSKLTLLGEASVPPLVTALEGAEPLARRRAATALHQLGSRARAAVLPLARALKCDDGHVRWAAVMTLKAIGGDAAEAVPYLEAARGDPEIAEHVEAALARIRWQPRNER